MSNSNTGFCTTCIKETAFHWGKKKKQVLIRDKDYLFTVTSAVCDKCGSEMSIPGLIDQNVKEIDSQYREAEGLFTTENI